MPKPEWVPGRHYARPNSRRQFVTISRFLFVSGILTVLSTMSLFAQTFGEVTGHISDATGAAKAPGIYKIRVEQA